MTRDASAEAHLLSAINSERSRRGLAAVRRNGCIDSFARNWSIHMGSQGSLSHMPNLLRLADCLPIARVAENVGTGNSISYIHTAFMNSPGHAANVLFANYTDVGISAMRDQNQRLWVTVQFADRR